MRERNLLWLFLGLNVALAAAFVLYLFTTTAGSQPEFKRAQAPAARVTEQPAKGTNVPAALPIPAAQVESAPATPIPPAAVEPVAPAVSAKKFTWQDVESPSYRSYLEQLRAVGCPEDKVRQIALADINELMRQRRTKQAVAQDFQWWRAEPNNLVLDQARAARGEALEAERKQLIEALLGPEASETAQSEALLSYVPLGGAVLGSLPAEKYNVVQEICQGSLQRNEEYKWARFNEGQALNQVELAKIREHTRAELRPVLTPDELEEFVLRYSLNASQLRVELSALEPSPEEFRRVFRRLDPLEHQMQLEFGSVEAMSAKQRERYERQRESAIREGLGSARYDVYLRSKDPLYRQALIAARQYGAPTAAIMPIYQMCKANESRRQQILNDASLTPQQKSEALNRVNQEQVQGILQIVNGAQGQRN